MLRILSLACVALGGASALSVDTAALLASSPGTPAVRTMPSSAKMGPKLRAGDLDVAFSASIFYQLNSSDSNFSYVGKMSQVPGVGQRMEILFVDGDQYVPVTMITDLKANQGSSLVMAGERQPAAVHALVAMLNEKLGNAGKTVTYIKEDRPNRMHPFALPDSCARPWPSCLAPARHWP